jgi:hypothetical protein
MFHETSGLLLIMTPQCTSGTIAEKVGEAETSALQSEISSWNKKNARARGGNRRTQMYHHIAAEFTFFRRALQHCLQYINDDRNEYGIVCH